MSTAPLQIVAYDPAWPGLFRTEQADLARVLRLWLAGPIEHIGSTAVPGLSAKPVIDIMAPVDSLAASRDAIQAVRSLSYCHAPYREEVMHWLCKPSPDSRTHHLHLVPFRSPLWIANLAFRDRLRADTALAAEYSGLKSRLAADFATDREAYTEGKTAFIAQVLG